MSKYLIPNKYNGEHLWMHGQSRYNGGGKGGGSDAPDYTPMAQASEKSAQIMSDQADRVLAEQKRQYDQNMAVAQPVIDTQTGLMRQQISQGDDYFNYMKSRSRPLEDSMLYESMGLDVDGMQQVMAQRALESQAAATSRESARQKYQTFLESRDAAAAGKKFDTSAFKDVAVPEIKYSASRSGKEDGNWVTNDYEATPQEVEANISQLTRRGFTREQAMAQMGYKVSNQDAIDSATRENERMKSMRDQLGQMSLPDGSRTPSFEEMYGGDSAFEDNSKSTALAMQLAGKTQAAQQKILDDEAARDAVDRTKIGAAQDNLKTMVEANDRDIYAKDADGIEHSVGTAVADARNGYSSAMNQNIRAGLRYGYSPAKLAAMAGSAGLSQAQMQAAAANATRNQQIDATRGRLTSGAQLGLSNAQNTAAMRQQDFARNRGYGIQDKSIAWGKKMDQAGLYRGLPGASQGAYGLANQAGNSAVSNQMQPSNQYMAGQMGAAGLVGQGQQMRINGLGSILNSQTSIYNNSQNSNDGFSSMLSGLGSLGMAAGGMGFKF